MSNANESAPPATRNESLDVPLVWAKVLHPQSSISAPMVLMFVARTPPREFDHPAALLRPLPRARTDMACDEAYEKTHTRGHQGLVGPSTRSTPSNDWMDRKHATDVGSQPAMKPRLHSFKKEVETSLLC